MLQFGEEEKLLKIPSVVSLGDHKSTWGSRLQAKHSTFLLLSTGISFFFQSLGSLEYLVSQPVSHPNYHLADKHLADNQPARLVLGRQLASQPSTWQTTSQPDWYLADNQPARLAFDSIPTSQTGIWQTTNQPDWHLADYQLARLALGRLPASQTGIWQTTNQPNSDKPPIQTGILADYQPARLAFGRQPANQTQTNQPARLADKKSSQAVCKSANKRIIAYLSVDLNGAVLCRI